MRACACGQCVTPSLSSLVQLVHQVHEIKMGDVHIDGGGNTAHIRIFSGPETSLIFTSPIFDRTALYSLDAIRDYLDWLLILNRMHKQKQLESWMDRLFLTRGHLGVCVRRVAGPVLCAWLHTWQKNPAAVKSMTDQEQSAYTELANKVHGKLVECSPVIEWAAAAPDLPHPDKHLWVCEHARQ